MQVAITERPEIQGIETTTQAWGFTPEPLLICTTWVKIVQTGGAETYHPVTFALDGEHLQDAITLAGAYADPSLFNAADDAVAEALDSGPGVLAA